jgi:hypothetical protein
LHIPLGSALLILKKANPNFLGHHPEISVFKEEDDLYLEDVTLGDSLGGGAFGNFMQISLTVVGEVFQGLWQVSSR